MHYMTFGLDPHIPHISLCQQQQPLSGNVILFKQVGVNLHAAKVFPCDRNGHTRFLLTHKQHIDKRLPRSD